MFHRGYTCDECMEEVIEVTPAQVEREVVRHGFTMSDIEADLGKRTTWYADVVLTWLGY